MGLPIVAGNNLSKHLLTLHERAEKKARKEAGVFIPNPMFVDLPVDLLKTIFGMLSHRNQLDLARTCKRFSNAINGQRWTVTMDDVVSNLITYMSHRKKVDTVITNCMYNEDVYKGDEEWVMHDVVGGVQRLFFASLLQPRKIKITHAQPWGLEPFLKFRKPNFFSSATKAVSIILDTWDKKVIGLNQIYFPLLWKATLGHLDFLSITFNSLGEDAMMLQEDEKEDIANLAAKLKGSKTQLNLHLDYDEHESYSAHFRQVMQDLPNVSIFVWRWDRQIKNWSYTRYCEGKEAVKTNLKVMHDSDFDAF